MVRSTAVCEALAEALNVTGDTLAFHSAAMGYSSSFFSQKIKRDQLTRLTTDDMRRLVEYVEEVSTVERSTSFKRVLTSYMLNK